MSTGIDQLLSIRQVLKVALAAINHDDTCQRAALINGESGISCPTAAGVDLHVLRDCRSRDYHNSAYGTQSGGANDIRGSCNRAGRTDGRPQDIRDVSFHL